MLESYARRTGDHVWAVCRESLLEAPAAGRRPGDFGEFLRARADQAELPGTLLVLLDEVAERAGRLTDLGPVRLVECADAALAKLISHDRRLRALCTPIGERHLAVSLDQEPAFRRALVGLGYALPAAASK